MGRPATPPDIIVRIKTLRAQGKTLDEMEVEMNGRVSRNTIAKYMRQWSALDAEFQWQDLESYGLPWEGSEFLLRMWQYLQGQGLFSQHGHPPTARLMKWCWQVHQALPEIPTSYPAGSAIWQIAQRFVQREQRHELLGKPLNTDDLMALLAYKPWAGDEHRGIYQGAISEGIIRALEKETIEGLAEAKEITVQDDPNEEPSDYLPRWIAWALAESSIKGVEAHA